jgi:hypothetical protein
MYSKHQTSDRYAKRHKAEHNSAHHPKKTTHYPLHIIVQNS